MSKMRAQSSLIPKHWGMGQCFPIHIHFISCNNDWNLTLQIKINNTFLVCKYFKVHSKNTQHSSVNITQPMCIYCVKNGNKIVINRNKLYVLIFYSEIHRMREITPSLFSRLKLNNTWYCNWIIDRQLQPCYVNLLLKY